MIEDVVMRLVTVLVYLFEGVLFVVVGMALLLLLLLYCSESLVVLGRYVETLAPVEDEMELMPPLAMALEKKLEYFQYSAEGRRALEKPVCVICLEVFEHGEDCSEVPDCQHLFHRDCIAVWMKSKTSCPLCRRHIVPVSVRVSAADDMV